MAPCRLGCRDHADLSDKTIRTQFRSHNNRSNGLLSAVRYRGYDAAAIPTRAHCDRGKCNHAHAMRAIAPGGTTPEKFTEKIHDHFDVSGIGACTDSRVDEPAGHSRQ